MQAVQHDQQTNKQTIIILVLWVKSRRWKGKMKQPWGPKLNKPIVKSLLCHQPQKTEEKASPISVQRSSSGETCRDWKRGMYLTSRLSTMGWSTKNRWRFQGQGKHPTQHGLLIWRQGLKTPAWSVTMIIKTASWQWGLLPEEDSTWQKCFLTLAPVSVYYSYHLSAAALLMTASPHFQNRILRSIKPIAQKNEKIESIIYITYIKTLWNII